MIRRIKLVNWRSHRETTLEFSGGTNILVGIMGAGKSSVLEGIVFGLFGTMPAVQRRRIRLSEIVREGCEEAYVILDFDRNGRRYSVKRTIRKGKGDAELRVDDRLVEVKPEAVSRYVEEVLGIDYDLFVRAVYSPQNGMDYFIALSPSERKRQLDEIVGIDEYEKVRSKAVHVINLLKRRLTDLEKEIESANVDDLHSRISDAERKRKALEDEKISLRSHLEDMMRKMDGVRAKLDEVDRVRKQRLSLTDRLTSFDSELKTLRSSYKGYDGSHLDNLVNKASEMDEILSKLSRSEYSLNERLSSLREALSDANRRLALVEEAKSKLSELESVYEEIDLGSVEEKLREEESKLLELEKKRSALEQEVRSLRADEQRLRDLEKRLSDLEKERDSLRDYTDRGLVDLRKQLEVDLQWEASLREIINMVSRSLEQLREAEGVCPVCGSPLDPIHKEELMNRRKAEIEEAKKNIEEVIRRISDLRGRIDDYRAKLEKKRVVDTEISTLRDEISELSGRYEKLKEKEDALSSIDVSSVRKTVEMLRARVEEARRMADIKKRMDELKKIVDKGRGLSDEVVRINSEIGKLEEERRRIVEERVRFERDKAHLRSEIDEVRKDIEKGKRIGEVEKEISKIRVQLDALSYNEEEEGRLRSELNRLSEELGSLRGRLTSVDEQIRLLDENLRVLKNDMERVERIAERIRRVSKAIDDYTLFSNALVEMQARLRSHVLTSINRVLAKVWPVLYPYKDISRVFLEADKRDYLIKIERNSEVFSLEGHVSGGERMTVALALRVALSMVLAPQLNLLILDEPTHNLDENGIRQLMVVLRENMPLIIKQMIVITHEETLKDAATGRMYILGRNKDRGEPTQILSSN
ncbi:MAG: AAA family ATPase [Candidatus Asgardarchaeia archaeon]